MVERMTAAEYRAGHKRQSRGDRRRVRGTKPVTVDGITFHSTREANRYRELKILEMAGEIRDLKLQVPFELPVDGGVVLTKKTRRPRRYIADFVYFDLKLEIEVIEDAKGHDTEVSELKRAIMEANGKPVRLV